MASFNNNLHRSLFLVLTTCVIFVSPPVALLVGIAVALTWGNPYAVECKKLTPKILSWCIIGMGAGMNLIAVLKAGAEGIIYTFAGIVGALVVGRYLAKALGADTETAMLVSVGTAICGGSAIAAVASTLRAKDSAVSVSLVTVFLLNALALVIFPVIGHALNLNQVQFGFWSALAIHDTSSVVGASLSYGQQAFEVGTTVKLARAIWIVPVTLILAGLYKPNDDIASPSAKRPYFILGFLAAAALVTYVPNLQEAGNFASEAAKRGLCVALFLIGASLNIGSLKTLGLRPFLFGVLLWLIVATTTLVAILAGLVG